MKRFAVALFLITWLVLGIMDHPHPETYPDSITIDQKLSMAPEKKTRPPLNLKAIDKAHFKHMTPVMPLEESYSHQLLQFQNALKAFVISNQDVERAMSAALRVDQTISCLFHLSPKTARADIKKMKKETVNTPEKIKDYLATDALLAGHVFQLQNNDELNCKKVPL